jgi:hypothetical protein
VQVGLRWLIDGPLPELRDPAFEIKLRRLARARSTYAEPPFTVVMVGSSVTSNLFNAKQIEQVLEPHVHRPVLAFNLGCHGGGPLTELVWAQRLLERGVRPDIVCIEFSPHLYHGQAPVDAARFPAYLLGRRDLRTVSHYVPDRAIRDEWRQHRWFPAYAHRLTILNYLAAPLVPVCDRIPTWGGAIDDRCWTPLETRPDAELQEVLRLVRISFEAQMREFTGGESSIEALDQLLALVQREQIPTALVMVPQGPNVRELYPRARLDSLLYQIAGQAARHEVSFVDAWDWLAEPMFTDSVHPTTEGATLFCARFTREHIVPLLGDTEMVLAGHHAASVSPRRP